ncbi:hypothetical protein AB1Y20_008170 [Prymnesium parvum]|uniref:Stress-response A/B barrel domain-containing protein n=1 Tax=Prymnesium parvum TaxID=97485 RepID=A0AB34IVT7_PRYPA
MAVRHVVMLKLKQDAAEEDKLRMVRELSSLKDVIPEIKSFHCGLDAGLAEGNHDFVLTADFASPEDYKAYATHPAHVAVIQEFIKPIVLSRSAVQFTL